MVAEAGAGTLSRRTTLWFAAAAAMIAVVVVVLLFAAVTSDDRTNDASAPDGRDSDAQEADGSNDEEDEADAAREMSASEGPPGRRSFDGIPTEIPAALVPSAATEVEGTVSRAGSDWSAAVTFLMDGDLELLPRQPDRDLAEEGFELRERVIESQRTVATYVGPDRQAVTVTYVAEDGLIRVTGIMVSG